MKVFHWIPLRFAERMSSKFSKNNPAKKIIIIDEETPENAAVHLGFAERIFEDDFEKSRIHFPGNNS